MRKQLFSWFSRLLANNSLITVGWETTCSVNMAFVSRGSCVGNIPDLARMHLSVHSGQHPSEPLSGAA